MSGRALPATLKDDLHHHVEALSDRWSVHMRYQAPKATATDVLVAQDAVDWINSNFNHLHS